MNEQGMGTEEAKDLELDENAKPVRRTAGKTAVPATADTDQKKRKGMRKVD
ncbi:MAG TPA: hypothetical protein VHA09_00020 [Nitrososphaera sp.]|nr:hypothetical protein [Nitrososphaera sp.]